VRPRAARDAAVIGSVVTLQATEHAATIANQPYILLLDEACGRDLFHFPGLARTWPSWGYGLF
jgi:hypothetical protein